MKKAFTLNLLVKYLYKETSFSENRIIKDSLKDDAEFNNYYQRLIEGYNNLPKIKIKPSNSCINNILNFSKNATMHLVF